tara:strand:- start:154 stop:528 length:375 start_codon:yes stop_codon:yes gene_type:complete
MAINQNSPSRENRPWGHYEILLETAYCKVKQITVNPNQRLSYQRHEKREEYWTIVKGNAIVILNDKKINLSEGQQIHIPQKTNHRIQNTATKPLIFIEIQRGSYFGEDDIIRLEDDYKRINNSH